MRSHRFMNSLLYLVIQLVAKENKAKENNAGVGRFFVLSMDKRCISQVFHFKGSTKTSSLCHRLFSFFCEFRTFIYS